MQKPEIQFHARIHSHASREGTVYDLNIIVFSNLQKHSMNLNSHTNGFYSCRMSVLLAIQVDSGRGKKRAKNEMQWRKRTNFLINEFR